jgi:hypothetical protein
MGILELRAFYTDRQTDRQTGGLAKNVSKGDATTYLIRPA